MGKGRAWSVADGALLARYARREISLKDACTVLGRSEQAIRIRVHKEGLSRQPWNQNLSPDVIASVARLYKSGSLMSEIGVLLGLSYHRVHWCLARMQIKTDRHRVGEHSARNFSRHLTDTEKQIVLVLWEQGVTIQEIGLRIQVSKKPLQRFLLAAGLTREFKELPGIKATRRQFEPAEINRLTVLALGDTSMSELAVLFQTSRPTIRREMQAQGIDTVLLGKEKAARAIKAAYASGRRHPAARAGHGIKTPAQTPFQGQRIMRSQTEAAWAMELNRQGTTWFYEAASYRVGNSRYTPDFWITTVPTVAARKELGIQPTKRDIQTFLDQHPCRIEDVKGWWDRQHPSWAKIAQFRGQFPQIDFGIRLWDRKTKRWMLWQ